MAGNDVFLYSVPTDADNDDVRLRDPTQTASAGVNGAAAQTIIISQTADGSVSVQGAAAQNVIITQAATGSVSVQGAAAQNVLISQSATGSVSVAGAAAQNVIIGQSAEGTVAAGEISGAAAQNITITQTAAGSLEAVAAVAALEAVSSGGARKKRKRLPVPPRELTDHVFRTEQPSLNRRKDAPDDPVILAPGTGAPARLSAPVPLSPEAAEALSAALAGGEVAFASPPVPLKKIKQQASTDDEEALMLILALAA